MNDRKREYLDVHSVLQYEGHNLVFIVGCPRSGTTWLQRLLASHPKIKTGQETDLFDYFIGPQLRAWQALLNDRSGRGVGLPCYFTEEEFLERLKAYLWLLLEPMIGASKNRYISWTSMGGRGNKKGSG